MAAKATWRILDLQTVLWVFSFARARAGNSNAARIAIMAITTNNSISVNAVGLPVPPGVLKRLGFIGHESFCFQIPSMHKLKILSVRNQPAFKRAAKEPADRLTAFL